eukprot:scaffold167_cov244-Pinguiococcus_pyrenoidosus.AAC.7
MRSSHDQCLDLTGDLRMMHDVLPALPEGLLQRLHDLLPLVVGRAGAVPEHGRHCRGHVLADQHGSLLVHVCGHGSEVRHHRFSHPLVAMLNEGSNRLQDSCGVDPGDEVPKRLMSTSLRSPPRADTSARQSWHCGRCEVAEMLLMPRQGWEDAVLQLGERVRHQLRVGVGNALHQRVEGLRKLPGRRKLGCMLADDVGEAVKRGLAFRPRRAQQLPIDFRQLFKLGNLLRHCRSSPRRRLRIRPVLRRRRCLLPWQMLRLSAPGGSRLVGVGSPQRHLCQGWLGGQRRVIRGGRPRCLRPTPLRCLQRVGIGLDAGDHGGIHVLCYLASQGQLRVEQDR